MEEQMPALASEVAATSAGLSIPQPGSASILSILWGGDKAERINYHLHDRNSLN